VDLAAKQIIVDRATTECDALLVKIVQEKRVADEQKSDVEAESAKIAVEAKKCNAIAADAEADLAEALPALERAMAEVDKLDNKSIGEVKAYAAPPKAVAMVLSAVMLFFGRKVAEKDEDNWPEAKKLISESAFLSNIKGYEKDSVAPAVLKKVKVYTSRPGFDAETVKGSSSAAAALCTWVLAIELYCTVAKEVEPKRAVLRAAESELSAKQALLAKAQAALDVVVAKVAALTAQNAVSVAEKTRLTNEAAALKDKLEKAETLIGGLAGERVRWEQSIKRFDADLASAPGDALVAAAFLSYAGPFDTAYRTALVAEWLARVKEQAVPASDDFNFSSSVTASHVAGVSHSGAGLGGCPVRSSTDAPLRNQS